MEKINIFKNPKSLMAIVLGFGILLLMVSGAGLYKSLIKGFSLRNDWLFLLNFLESIVFISIYLFFTRKSKYFIEWNDKMVSWYLPGTSKIQSYSFDELDDIRINILNISFNTCEGRENLNLDSLDYDTIKRLKSVFPTFRRRFR